MNGSLRKEAKLSIAKFVIKNFSPEGKRITGKRRKKAIQYHLNRLVGRENNLFIILKENEGLIRITRKGNLIDW
jgi:hypothetical protein